MLKNLFAAAAIIALGTGLSGVATAGEMGHGTTKDTMKDATMSSSATMKTGSGAMDHDSMAGDGANSSMTHDTMDKTMGKDSMKESMEGHAMEKDSMAKEQM